MTFLASFFGNKPIDWNARLEADRAMRERFIGKPFLKKREAALKATRGNSDQLGRA